MNALYVICGLGVASLLAEIANLKKWLTAGILVGLAVALVLFALDWNTTIGYFNNMLVFDNFSLAFAGLITLVAILWYWMCSDYFEGQSHQTDRASLILFVMTGGVIMVSYNNMSMLFLGIEVLSVSLYVLTGSRKENLFSTEASYKYFLMGSFATGFLLFGIALVYGATGSFDISVIAGRLAEQPSPPVFFYTGVLMMFIGIAFKISAVPFHFWAPDVYDGAPTSITAFMSTVVKIAALGAFYRLFSVCFYAIQDSWGPVVQVVTFLTLVVPNITAVYQSSVKRMLAYSSVGHVGYILLSFTGTASPSVLFYYLASYALASLAAFAVLKAVESPAGDSSIEKFKGLFNKNPIAALGMTLALLSLAGIPPLAGFFGKYMVFAMALQQGHVGLVMVAVITSLAGVFYYFRVIVAMYSEGSETAVTIPGSHRWLIALLSFLILALGLFPDAVKLL